MNRLLTHRLLLASCVVLIPAALYALWLVRVTPYDPPWSRGVLRLDGLAALWIALTALYALVEFADSPAPRRMLTAALLLCLAYPQTHLAMLGGLVGLAAFIAAPRRLFWLVGAAALAALLLIGLQADSWRYPSPTAGLGLNSLSVGLLLGATLLACWLPRHAAGAADTTALPAPHPLLAAALFYCLLRLFVLGPWNLGWLFAAQLLGTLGALWAAWAALRSRDPAPTAWLSLYLLSSALVGIGLSSGAGVGLVIFALLALAVLRLGLRDAPGSLPVLTWAYSPALPLSLPFTAAWAAVAAALAGGLSIIAAALWAAALLAALPLARLAVAPPTDGRACRTHWLAAGLSLLGGIAAPGISALLIEPLITQLQAGLTPFGDLALWPWAGLIALNAARQPVATLPSLALLVLMLVLAALAWLLIGLFRLRTPAPDGLATKDEPHA